MELIAIIISVISLILTIIHIIISSLHERRKDTLDAFNILQVQALDVINSYSKLQLEKIEKSNKDSDYLTVSSCLARIEHFCVGINQGIYDKKVLNELTGPYFLGVYNKLKPIIDKKQSNNSNERFYNNFEEVIENIKTGRLKKNKRS